MLFLWFLAAFGRLEPAIVWNLEKHAVFAHWTSFDVSDQDLLAIIDPTSKQLLLIDAMGELRSRCGAEGDGPGEFRSPRLVQWLPGDGAFLVFDQDHRQASLWSPTGRLVKAFHLPLKLLESSEFLDQDSLFYIWKPYGEGGNKPTLLNYRISSKKYAPVWEYDLKDKKFTKVPMARGETTMILPWDGFVCFDVGADFIAVTYPDAEAISILDLKGRLLDSFTPRGIKIYPIVKEQVQRVIEERDREMAAALKAHPNKLVVPQAWPLVKGIRIDDRNRIWVTGSENRATGFHPLVVYDRLGKILYETEIQNVPRRLHGDALYYIHITEDTNLNLQKVIVKIP